MSAGERHPEKPFQGPQGWREFRRKYINSLRGEARIISKLDDEIISARLFIYKTSPENASQTMTEAIGAGLRVVQSLGRSLVLLSLSTESIINHEPFTNG